MFRKTDEWDALDNVEFNNPIDMSVKPVKVPVQSVKRVGFRTRLSIDTISIPNTLRLPNNAMGCQGNKVSPSENA